MAAFDREMATYRAMLYHLLTTLNCEGQHVVIQGETCLGIERTYDDALALGYRVCGLTPFMVKQVHAVKPVHTITRLLTGEARLIPEADRPG